jgi:vacuolar-type H+-ATPase subunit E/Vma4
MIQQAEKMQQLVLADAERKAAKLIETARQETAAAVKKAEDQAIKEREAVLEKARRTATDRCRAIRAGAGTEIRRQWLSRRETVFETLFNKAQAGMALLPPEEKRAAVQALAVEALLQLGPVPARLLVSSSLEPFLSAAVLDNVRQLLPAAHAGVPLTLVVDATMDEGVAAVAADGRRRVDNTWIVRLQRQREAFRSLASARLPAVVKDGPLVKR